MIERRTMSKHSQVLKDLNIDGEIAGIHTGGDWQIGKGETFTVTTPIDGAVIGELKGADEAQYNAVVEKAKEAFLEWRTWPAPARGEIIRQIGNKLRENKAELGRLVTLEMGKIYSEGLGEVQEMIDVCDMAVGMSRQLHGHTMHSERPEHRMYEQYHPLGAVAIISAFNFPVAVWSWNAMIAAICGDVCIWKPSEKTPLTAVACHRLIQEVLQENKVPEGVFNLVVGGRDIGELMANDKRIPLVSATGSTRMGKSVAAAVGARLGKSLLELGGNNAIIVSPDADLDLAIRAIVFGAVGTCGQRCTSTRRLIVHESKYDQVRDQLIKAYGSLRIGNPMDQETLVGPLIDQLAVDAYTSAIQEIKNEGGSILCGGNELEQEGYYVAPTIAEVKADFSIIKEETFAPILYLIQYSGDISQAIEIQNNVDQGLSSSIFSNNVRETELFLSHWGSDCGIANVNIGTSGAEIGGAFGGEKDTGGGRESGSDSWKFYMRRQTNTINFGAQLPLAQGVVFDV